MEPKTDRADATAYLLAVARGEAGARERLFEIVYDDLRRRAAGLLQKERREHTLQPTALVHEAWMRLIREDQTRPIEKNHFLALATQAMRRVLVDHARARLRARRGGQRLRVEMPKDVAAEPVLDPYSNFDVILDANDLIEKLKADPDPKQARKGAIFEMHFFGALSEQELATALDVSVPTIKRDLHVVRTMLQAGLGRSGEGTG